MTIGYHALVVRPVHFAADLLTLCRPVAAFCAGVQVAIGAHLTWRTTPSPVSDTTLLRACVVIVLIVATVNVVNDIVDVSADAISQPSRPLAAGRVPTAAAWCLASAQALTAVVCSVGIPGAVGVTMALIAIGLCYDFVLKGTVLAGNFVVAVLAATPIVFGGWLGRAEPRAVLLTASIIFLYMFAYEILKTARDEVADRTSGYRTVATQWGVHTTSVLFRGLLTGYAVVAATPLLLPHVSWRYGLLMLPCAVLPPLCFGWVMPVARSDDAVRVVLRVMALSWFPGLAAFALGFR